MVGESACADSWGRALKLRQPALSIPCFAERRYGGVLDEEMLMALPPEFLPKAIAGMEALANNGFRYPFPAVRHPAGRARRHGAQLSGTGEGELTASRAFQRPALAAEFLDLGAAAGTLGVHCAPRAPSA